MWREITNETELKDFWEKHYSFHDSCLKELKYVRGAYAADRHLHPLNDKRALSVICQGPDEAYIPSKGAGLGSKEGK